MTAAPHGLTSAEAASGLARHGANELQIVRTNALWEAVKGVVKEPMFLLLIGCSATYFLLGNLEEALFLGSAVFVVVGITVVQSLRTEKTLESLKSLASPRAMVLRDGVYQRLPAREVVPGDVLLVEDGDRVPADCQVLSADGLSVDESLLTGESAPVAKAAGADRAFAGTMVVRGRGQLHVERTGAGTAMGRIHASLASTTTPASPLVLEMRSVVRKIAIASLTLSGALAAIWWIRSGNPLEGLLAGLTFAMATVPEEVPVVVTVFIAFGAWRIAKSRVLTRQLPAIEALGAATVLCSDKTGTMTENRMTLAKTWPEAPEVAAAWAKASADPESLDPIDRSLVELPAALPASLKRVVKAYPFRRSLMAAGRAWEASTGSKYLVVLKGAPEAVVELCHLAAGERSELLAAATKLAGDGLRVLGVARAAVNELPEPETLGAITYELMGLIAFEDPVRPGVPDAVASCRRAGIKVLMITGDHPETAAAIGRAAGLGEGAPLTGREIAALPDDELAARLARATVLARVTPEQKLRVVEILKRGGEVVAMTGDGVNDAPALKAAHIGVAMGRRGTDVAREASGLVLLDDDFSSIVQAVSLGRRIYDNIEKAVSYVIAIHVPIVGLAVYPAFSGSALILLPVHLAFLELIIDPVCAIVFEAEPGEAGAMKRPPRRLDRRLFNRQVVLQSLAKGLAVLAAVLFVQIGVFGEVAAEDRARTAAFATLLFANVGLILSMHSRRDLGVTGLFRPTKAMLAVGSALAVVGAAVFFVPTLRAVFRFAPPALPDFLTSLAVAAASLALFELAKVAPKLQILAQRKSN